MTYTSVDRTKSKLMNPYKQSGRQKSIFDKAKTGDGSEKVMIRYSSQKNISNGKTLPLIQTFDKSIRKTQNRKLLRSKDNSHQLPSKPIITHQHSTKDQLLEKRFRPNNQHMQPFRRIHRKIGLTEQKIETQKIDEESLELKHAKSMQSLNTIHSPESFQEIIVKCKEEIQTNLAEVQKKKANHFLKAKDNHNTSIITEEINEESRILEQKQKHQSHLIVEQMGRKDDVEKQKHLGQNFSKNQAEVHDHHPTIFDKFRRPVGQGRSQNLCDLQTLDRQLTEMMQKCSKISKERVLLRANKDQYLSTNKISLKTSFNKTCTSFKSSSSNRNAAFTQNP